MTDFYVIPHFLDLCECCRQSQHNQWIESEPYIWVHPETGSKIERRGVLLCDCCYQERKEFRKWRR